MRICFVNQHSERSGGDISLFHLVKGLLPLVEEIHIILPHAGPFTDWYMSHGVKVHYAPQPSLAIDARAAWKWASQFPASLWGVARVIRQIRPDIVHTNSTKNLYGPLAARMLGLPHVLHVRNTFKKPRMFYQAMGFVSFFCSDVVITASESVRELFPASLGSTGRVRTVYNGVDLDRFHPGVSGDGFRQELGISDNDLLVGIISHMNSNKGQHIAMDGFANIAASHPRVRLIFVGAPAPEYEERLIAMAEEKGIGGQVIMCGERSDIPEVMAAMDVILFPSLYEAFPRVVIEALAMGKPLVASAVGGVPEAVAHGNTGLLFPPGDVDALSLCLQVLLVDERKRCEMGKQARQAAEKCFSAEQCTNDVLRLYGKVLNQ